MRMLAESITGERAARVADADLREQRLAVRIDRLEDAVRVHSTQIKDLREELRRDIAALRGDFERRDAERLSAIEARVDVLEKRTGIG